FPRRHSARRGENRMTIILIVTPSINAKGVRASSVRGQLYDVRLQGRLIVDRSPQPFLDSGRALLAEGVDPAAPIVMRRSEDDVDALQSTVGVAAGLTVQDSGGKPVFRPWQPYDGPSRVPVSSSARESDDGASTPGEEKLALEAACAEEAAHAETTQA